MHWYNWVANILFMLLVLFALFMLVVGWIYRDKREPDLTGQSDRQKKNDDYDTFPYV